MIKPEPKRLTLVIPPKLYQQIRVFAFKKEQKMATAIRDLLGIALKKAKDPN